MGLGQGFIYRKRKTADLDDLRMVFDQTTKPNLLKSLKIDELKTAGLNADDIKLVQAGKVPKGYLITNHQHYTTGDLSARQQRQVP